MGETVGRLRARVRFERGRWIRGMIGRGLRMGWISGCVIGVVTGSNRRGRGELAGDSSRIVGLIGRNGARVRVLKVRLVILVIGRTNVAVFHIGIFITDRRRERFERRLAD